MSKVMKAILIIVVILILAVVGVAIYTISSMRSGAVDTVKAPEGVMDASQEEEPYDVSVIEVAGATPEPTAEPTQMPIYEQESAADNVVNVLLVGTDSRSKAEDAEGRSDTMILASLNRSTGTVTLVSFMRDARVKRIGTKGTFSFENKLNGAYRGGYGGGGPGELINTLNYNFDLDIQQYICVGFDGFATLIDKIGGLDVELDQAEINFINDRITGEHILEPDIVKKADTLKVSPGLIHLNGVQALIHARNRHTGVDGGEGNDFDRVNRQQEIIQLVYKKILREMNATSIAALISFATDYITTNMDLGTMTSLATTLMANDMSFNSTTIPQAGSYTYYVQEPKEGDENAVAVKTDQLKFDRKAAAEMLHTMLYGEDAAQETDSAGN